MYFIDILLISKISAVRDKPHVFRLVQHAMGVFKLIREVFAVLLKGGLKVHKIEIFFGFDFEFCIISLLVTSKY